MTTTAPRPTRPSFRERLELAASLVRRIIGVPDYDRYAAHMRQCHPGEPLPTREEFFRSRLEAKYKTPGSRCC